MSSLRLVVHVLAALLALGGCGRVEAPGARPKELSRCTAALKEAVTPSPWGRERDGRDVVAACRDTGGERKR
jgi:hypothetical protein